MIKLGQKVEFDPLDGMLWYGAEHFHEIVTGTVVEIHEDHRWFLVEYGEDKIKIGFKFDDVGETVKIVEE